MSTSPIKGVGSGTKKPSNLPQELLDLSDKYVHGEQMPAHAF
jgi:hypothetical protein